MDNTFIEFHSIYSHQCCIVIPYRYSSTLASTRRWISWIWRSVTARKTLPASASCSSSSSSLLRNWDSWRSELKWKILQHSQQLCKIYCQFGSTILGYPKVSYHCSVHVSLRLGSCRRFWYVLILHAWAFMHLLEFHLVQNDVRAPNMDLENPSN